MKRVLLLALLLLMLNATALAWPELTVTLVRDTWGTEQLDVYCPLSEDCARIEVLDTWPGRVDRLAANHLTLYLYPGDWDHPIWVRIFARTGGWVDHLVEITRKPAFKAS